MAGGAVTLRETVRRRFGPLARGEAFEVFWTRAHRLAAVLGGDLGTIFLVPIPFFGIALWIAIAAKAPVYAAFGLFGLGVGHVVARALAVTDNPMLGGGIKANALLMAMATSWLTAPVAIPFRAKVLVAAVSAVAAAVTTAAIIRALSRSERRRYRPYRAGNNCAEDGGYGMPSLACGYSIIAGALFVLFPAWTSAAVRATPAWAMPAGVSAWADTFFRSLGALIFTPTLEAGVLIAAALLLWSRTLLAAGTVGWLSGAYTAVTIQGLGADFYWLPASYNFFLTGMALGAVFLLPGRTSLLLAAVGGCGCAVLAAMLQHVAPGWAYLPISSVLAIWIGLGAVTISEDRTHFWRNYAHGFPPEEAWWREANWARRFGRRDPLLVVPLPGLVQVSQGFNGKLSHVGRWSHAVDLQRPPGDTEGASSIWGAPVTAPAAGVVERVRDGIADNAVGISNYADNWGNYVVIRLDQGGWALLAHLRCRSIEVKTGMRVEIGSRVGSAGNSGRSPIPHVHLQVQRGPEPGTPTIPFRIANYLSVDASPDSVLRWHSMSVPSEKAIIMASTPNPSIRSILSSLLFGTAVWVVDSEGTIPRAFRPEDSSRTLQVDVRADASGQHIFACGSAATMACSSDVDAWRVLELSHAAPPLFRLVALGAPSIPHAAKTGMVWEDLAPLNAGRAGRFGLEILPYLTQPFLRLRCTCRAAPALERDPLVIEMSPAAQGETLPVRVTSQFELLRGPVKVEALFPRGRVTYSLLSFEPGFSLRDA